jgi:hypothetical protein
MIAHAAHVFRMIRHTGAGIWVAVQRLLFFLFSLLDGRGTERMYQMARFELAAFGGVVLTMLAAELVIWAQRSRKK